MRRPVVGVARQQPVGVGQRFLGAVGLDQQARAQQARFRQRRAPRPARRRPAAAPRATNPARPGTAPPTAPVRLRPAGSRSSVKAPRAERRDDDRGRHHGRRNRVAPRPLREPAQRAGALRRDQPVVQVGPEVLGQRGRALVAPRRVLLHRLGADRLEVGRDPAVDLPRRPARSSGSRRSPARGNRPGRGAAASASRRARRPASRCRSGGRAAPSPRRSARATCRPACPGRPR